MRDELADMGGDLRPLEEKTNMVFFCFLMVGMDWGREHKRTEIFFHFSIWVFPK